MFSILQKSQDSVNAEDLETLQNEIEKHLVRIVTEKWDLESELSPLTNTSPEVLNNHQSQPSTASTASTNTQSTSTTNSMNGKLRNRNVVNDINENSSDSSKTNSNPNYIDNLGSASCANSTEDSISSESSLVSSLTGSTIITPGISESGSLSLTTSSATGTKRSHKSSNDRPSKRFRQNSNNSFTSNSGVLNKRPPHSKHRSKIVPSKFRNPEESRPNKKQIFKNEAPDKLWPFVEQFCATPTQKQIVELEEMIKAMENNKEYFKLPALGKKESLIKDSPSKNDNTKNQKKIKIKAEEEGVGLGALTQRLVSSLIEDGDSNSSESIKESSQVKKKNVKQTKSSKGIDINHAKNLEKRIRQELEEYEILNQQDDIPYTSEDDEILRDLVTSQRDLLTIHFQNKESMQRLLKKAKKHIELEAERAKLKEANDEVISTYYRLIQAKQKKRNPTKKEKDAAWKAVKTQEAIFKKCDDLYISNLSGND